MQGDRGSRPPVYASGGGYVAPSTKIYGTTMKHTNCLTQSCALSLFVLAGIKFSKATIYLVPSETIGVRRRVPAGGAFACCGKTENERKTRRACQFHLVVQSSNSSTVQYCTYLVQE